MAFEQYERTDLTRRQVQNEIGGIFYGAIRQRARQLRTRALLSGVILGVLIGALVRDFAQPIPADQATECQPPAVAVGP